MKDYQVCFIFIFIFLVMFLCIGCVMENMIYKTQVAAIESLRKESFGLKNEFLTSKIIEQNMKIAKKKAQNNTFIFQLTIPNEWDTVEPIKIQGE